MKTRVIAVLVFLLVGAVFLTNITYAGLQPKEGYVDVDGGKVWYRIVGPGDATPLLILHGGPGIPSAYLNPLQVLADERPVIFYDQLGCGKSPAETDSTDWTIDHFVKRLDEIRAALGLEDVYLYGHSWGSVLAVEYYLAHPEGVKGLILAGPALDMEKWVADANVLLGTLPDSVQQVVRKHEANGTFDAPEYQAAVHMYYEKYVARKLPWSADMDTAFGTMNPAIYTYICGASEFSLTGTLNNYNITGRLGEIKVPTLVSVGEFDEARVSTAEYYASLIPGAKLVVVPNAAHLTFQDNIEADAKNLREFLRGIENK